jgi:hypothetical protein
MSDSKRVFPLRSGTPVVVVWGGLYGILWSLAPGILSELLKRPGEAATVFLSGAVTGILVSYALGPWLARTNRAVATLLGILSLPLGAALFGAVISWIHRGILMFTGIHYRFVMQIEEAPGFVFSPLQTARDYALFASCTPLAIVFLPLAILTTFHLRRKFHSSGSTPMP